MSLKKTIQISFATVVLLWIPAIACYLMGGKFGFYEGIKRFIIKPLF